MRAKLFCGVAAAALVFGSASAGAQSDMRRDVTPGGGQGQMEQRLNRGNDAPSQRDRASPMQERRSAPDADRAAQGSDRMGTTGQAAPRDAAGQGGAAAPATDDLRQGDRRQGERTQPGQADRRDQRDQDDRAGDDQMRTGQQDRLDRRDRGQATQRGEPRDVDRAVQDRDRTRGQADRERTRDRDRAGRDAPSRQRDSVDRDRRDRGQADRRDRDATRVSVTQQQRTRIRDVIARTNVRAVTNVNFSVSVGAVVPRTVVLHDLPPAIVEIVPQYRGYRYIVVRDEIVIVHPETMRIVTVIPGSGSVAERSAPSRVEFSDEQRGVILRHARRARPLSDVDFDLEVGETVPSTVELLPFPEAIFGEVPVVRPYRYFVVEDDVVLVDPDGNRIIGVIEE